MFVHMYICVYTYTYVCTHVHMCVHMYVCVYTCTYVCMCVHMYVRMYVCTYVRMCVHMYVHTQRILINLLPLYLPSILCLIERSKYDLDNLPNSTQIFQKKNELWRIN